MRTRPDPYLCNSVALPLIFVDVFFILNDHMDIFASSDDIEQILIESGKKNTRTVK